MRCWHAGPRSLALALAFTAVVGAGDGQAAPRIVNGTESQSWPTVAALLEGTDATSATTICSAVLVGCRTVLTASHCVDGSARADRLFVFLQHAGLFPVASILRHPDSEAFGFPNADVAVLQLADAVTGISPSRLAGPDGDPGLGVGASIVGFGASAAAGVDTGIKREGRVVTAACDQADVDDDVAVCWDFLAPVGAPGEDSNTCLGDSGGPLFVDGTGGALVAGVTSGGTRSDCAPGDQGFDARVAALRAFLDVAIGADSTAACSDLPPVGHVNVDVAAQQGFLDVANAADTYTVAVPANARELRVTLNAADGGDLDADLYVLADKNVTTERFDCKAEGGGNYGACRFLDPIPTFWSILVRRVAGAGSYQLTATTFIDAEPVCGNGAIEGGEECDGGDDAICPGSCRNDCRCAREVGQPVLATSASGQNRPGGKVRYRIAWASPDRDATSVRVVDTFGPGLEGIKVRTRDAQVSTQGNVVTLDIGNLAAGGAGVATVTARIGDVPDGTIVRNEVAYSDGEGATAFAAADLEVDDREDAIRLDFVARDRGAVQPGGKAQYVIKYDGLSTINQLSVRVPPELLPARLRPDPSSLTPGVVVWTNLAAPRGKVKFSCKASVDADTSAGVVDPVLTLRDGGGTTVTLTAVSAVRRDADGGGGDGGSDDAGLFALRGPSFVQAGDAATLTLRYRDVAASGSAVVRPDPRLDVVEVFPAGAMAGVDGSWRWPAIEGSGKVQLRVRVREEVLRGEQLQSTASLYGDQDAVLASSALTQDVR